ncbi:hypothetical protein [Nocardia niwae]|nr:hypothetical protein [Nocardia niwae]
MREEFLYPYGVHPRGVRTGEVTGNHRDVTAHGWILELISPLASAVGT